MKIKFLTAGGTIDKVYFDQKSAYQVGESRVGELLAEVGVAFEYEIESIIKKDSLDMTDEDRALIVEKAKNDPNRRLVITHGTDTMIETAKRLKSISNKTIVLTGSLQPAIFKTTDAIFNVGCAVIAAQTLPPGVYVTMNGRVFNPDNAVKNRERNRFEEIND